MAEESIFPFLQPTAAAPAAELPVLRECAWDFAADKPILRQGVPVVVERAEAGRGVGVERAAHRAVPLAVLFRELWKRNVHADRAGLSGGNQARRGAALY